MANDSCYLFTVFGEEQAFMIFLKACSMTMQCSIVFIQLLDANWKFSLGLVGKTPDPALQAKCNLDSNGWLAGEAEDDIYTFVILEIMNVT